MGLRGGIDSSLVAVIAASALGKESVELKYLLYVLQLSREMRKRTSKHTMP